MLATIDWGTIGQLLWAAPLAGIAVAVTFSLLILGLGRAQEAQREGAGLAATLYSGLALLSLLAFAAVVVYSVEIITTK